MTKLTVEETNLLSIYKTGSRQGLIVAMNAALLSGSFRHLCPSARYPFPYGFLCIVCAEGFKAGEAFLSGGAA